MKKILPIMWALIGIYEVIMFAFFAKTPEELITHGVWAILCAIWVNTYEND